MQRLHELIGRVLGIPADRVTDATAPENTESWDSYNALMLVSELEEMFLIQFTLDEVVAVKNVKDIKEALTRHGAAFEV
jgi:acyl carrier protein